MKSMVLALPLVVAVLGLSACKKQTNDNDAIRAGILQHLTSIGTLNMSAMDMNVRSVSVAGNQAHAEVEFRVKTSDAPGMQVAYDLEKRSGAWVVLKSQPLGGIQHPNTNQNPSSNQPVHSMPNFNELLNPSGTPAQGALPPGHPPVSAPQSASPQAAQVQPSAKKPQ